MVRMHGIFQKDLKNRSSKHLIWFTGPGHKDILRKVSNTQLEKWVHQEVRGADKEMRRRKSKTDNVENK